MPRVLFWNVQRKQLDGLVVSPIAGHAPDVVVLVETPPRSHLATLLAPSGWRRVNRSDCFTVLAKQGIQLTHERNARLPDRIEFWHVEPAVGDDWLFVLVHGLDRRNATDDTRTVLFRHTRETIRLWEDHRGHRRTVVLGDLNANPYDPAVLGASGFHALGVKRVRGLTDRAIRGSLRDDFFYNPVWRLYGTDPVGDAGAGSYYYHDGYDAVEPFWHLLDQVLIRPEHAERLPPDELRLLTVAGGIRLTDTDNRPNPDVASDHLPVVFALK